MTSTCTSVSAHASGMATRMLTAVKTCVACRSPGDLMASEMALISGGNEGLTTDSRFAVHDLLRYRTVWLLLRANGVFERCSELARQDASTLSLARYGLYIAETRFGLECVSHCFCAPRSCTRRPLSGQHAAQRCTAECGYRLAHGAGYRCGPQLVYDHLCKGTAALCMF